MTIVVSNSNVSESRKTSRAVIVHLICTSSIYQRHFYLSVVMHCREGALMATNMIGLHGHTEVDTKLL